MKNTLKIRKGDKVIVITGKNRNAVGTVERVMPAKMRAIVAGVNMVKKHLKRSSKNPQGGIIDIPASIHISNLMLLDPKTNKPTRVSYAVSGTEKTRLSTVSKQPIQETK